MLDAGSPHRVVALLLEEEGSARQLDTELALDEKDDGRPLFVGVPGVALVAGRVDAPLDLDGVGDADAGGVVEEMADQPATVLLAVDGRVADVPVVRHHAPTSISGRATRDTVSSSARRRRPSMKAKRPSLLHLGTAARACRPAVSREE